MSAACDIRNRDVELATTTAAELSGMHKRLPPPSHEDDAISPRTPPCGRSYSPDTPPVTPTMLPRLFPRHAGMAEMLMQRPTLQSIKVRHRLAKLRRNSPTLIHHAPLLEMFEQCC
jgi:hypothetical protein